MLNKYSESIDSLFSIDKLSGDLKTRKDLIESTSHDYKVAVTDNKFITEADLNIQINRIEISQWSIAQW